MLSSYVKDNQKSWGSYVNHVACAIRTARHEVTGYTPFYLNFGREMVLFGGNHVNKKPVLSFEDRGKYGNSLVKLSEISKLYGRNSIRRTGRAKHGTICVRGMNLLA